MKDKLIILFLLLCSMVHAQVPIAQLKQAEADFIQTRVSMALTEPLRQNGHFRYVAPDSIAWSYQNVAVQLPGQMLGMIKQAVSGHMQGLEQTFSIVWNDKQLQLLPKKKQMQRFFSKIVIDFTPQGVAQHVLLVEPTGDTTDIEFINMKYSL